MIKIFKRNKNKINKEKIANKELKNCEYFLNEIDDNKLKKISFFAREILETKSKNNLKKILYLPSYYQSKYTRALDATFILSLQIRGAEIIPVLTNLFFRNCDIFIANTQSKSTLRAVIGELESKWSNLFYFPSYEISMNYNDGFEDDKRHVKPELADFIIKSFTNSFLK